MRKNMFEKIEVTWDTSNEMDKFTEAEKLIIRALNLYKRGTLQRQIETIDVAKRLKRSYKSIYNESIGSGGNRPDRNRYGVSWALVNEGKEYSAEELILMSKIAVHKRAPQGSVTDLAMQYGRTPWAMTFKISQLRKSGEWKNWLEVERKQFVRG
ncbi:hypothetical protein [Exiguobacterium sp. s133]|uniref:hypothetical protein n=1 Tax=Exiguobacterium sp. s133 TaxID=2751213 RepID=UPI001BEC85BD|nr:hypothetical protein [Exiguobacterium sp. s133]